MQFLKRNAAALCACLLDILIGALLLIDPVGFTSGILVAVGVFLIFGGLGNILRYFRMESEEAVVSQSLFRGLLQLLVGLFCAFRSKWFLVTFPVLTILYGAAILVAGLRKVQWTVDLLRGKRKKWILAAVSAALSLFCGLVILHNPFTSTAVLWLFAGVSMIAEAVYDIILLFFGDREAAVR